MNKMNFFSVGLFLCVFPFLLCFVSGRSFAPFNSLYSTNLPYAADANYSPPNNHFWSDTVNFYWPRFTTITRHEFPISFSSGGGGPNYSDTISGFFSPYCLFVFGLLPTGLHSLDLVWLLQFAVYFAGLYFWFSTLGIAPLGAALGALTQSYCTAFFPGSYLSFQTLGALSFLPWALWSEEHFRNSRHRFSLPGIFLALSIFSGNVQTALYPLLIFGIWGLVQKKIWETIYSGCLAILLSLPLWLPGIQYHILQGVQDLANRRSQVPPDLLGRLRVLFALPAVFLPDLYGSTKSIDFMKGFKTSATYFIGSIGFIGPLLCLLNWRRELLKRREVRFALALLVFSLLVMLTPLLNFLYYRILCVVCFALSLLLAISFDNFFEKHQKSKVLLKLSGLFLVGAGIAFFSKQRYHIRIAEVFSQKLQESTYAWNKALLQSRIDNWFSSYLSNSHFLALAPLLLATYFAIKTKNRLLLASLIFLELVLVWSNQVTFDAVVPPEHSSYALIKQELEKSPSFPASRFLPLACEKNKAFLFPFSINEFQAVPTIQYYGSTAIRRLPGPQAICNEAIRSISFVSKENLQRSALNVFVTDAGWKIDDSSYHAIFQNSQYTIWSRPSFSAIWANKPAGEPLSAKTLTWDGWQISWHIEAEKAVQSWSLSLPYYPGWHYQLDSREITPNSIEFTVPSFTEELTPGAHTVIAFFKPSMLYWGLLGSLLGLLIILWKSILTHD